MKTIIFFSALSSFFVLQTAFAANSCDSVKAVREYYQGGDSSVNVAVLENNGVFAVTYTEMRGNQQAVCKGGLARVNFGCQVQVIRGSFCNFL